MVDALQLAVSFSQVQHGLNRYLQARTGKSLSVHPLSELSKPTCSLPRHLWYVPAETAFTCRMKSVVLTAKSENLFLYKCLTRLEACYHEFGTYEFDLEMAIEACNDSEDIKDQKSVVEDRIRQIRIEDDSEPGRKKDPGQFNGLGHESVLPDISESRAGEQIY